MARRYPPMGDRSEPFRLGKELDDCLKHVILLGTPHRRGWLLHDDEDAMRQQVVVLTVQETFERAVCDYAEVPARLEYRRRLLVCRASNARRYFVSSFIYSHYAIH